ncbi:uncharacterized protein B0H18DRAFT_979877 [Fomitopsis serialis]|uniref:uncharacterized protein n=1 Tax=Fomitopsis serialis TaxID=139415 RepID=UPI002007446D|nr:uncharacterized protein B0H18DRAFT_979877 [Neoantrodia serialis]KAH9934190.1 hypothetical protein B0H18DRAFT_979877 [Neoantrodia serialis]
MHLPIAAVFAFILFPTVWGGCKNQLQQRPVCASACWDVAVYGACDSANPDANCLCNEPIFAESVASCIENTCSTGDIIAYARIADDICAEVVCGLFHASRILYQTTVSAMAD